MRDFFVALKWSSGRNLGKVYAIWDFQGLSGQKAMETAVLIAFVVACVYALCSLNTYRISCDRVICSGTDGGREEERSL